MSGILRNKSKRADYRLVGVHIPPSTYNKLAIYTLANGIANSCLFNELIDEKLDSIEEEDILLGKIYKRYWKEWTKRKKEKPRSRFEEYCNMTEKELLYKGLNKTQIRHIITQLQYENDTSHTY